MSEHHKHHWTIVEGDGPPPRAARGSYAEMWRELLLRLEVTPSKWLQIPCADAKETARLANGLRKRAWQLPEGVIQIAQDTGACMVYVARGPNWAMREAGSLAHIPAHPLDTPGEYERQRLQRAQRANGKPRGKPGRPRKVRETN